MIETKRLFDTDSYKIEFDAEVLECIKDGDKYGVVLDETAFFPEEGGQGCDGGRLDGKEVLHVSIKNNIITHYVKEELQKGARVHGSIDWENRFSNMQQHTGEHIVSGLIHGRFGFDNVGFHLGSTVVTLDFNGTFSDDELAWVEHRANEIITGNRPVSVSFPDSDALAKLNYRSKKELEGAIRIVTIEGVDVCACCAPHVALTGEIGALKFVSAEHFRGGTRISMLCGFRALADYGFKQSQQHDISVMLSVKPENIVLAVEKLKSDIDACKYQLVNMQKRLLDAKLAGFDDVAATGKLPKVLMIFEDKLDSMVMREAINNMTERFDGYMAVFSGNDSDGYSYIIGSKKEDCRVILNALKERLGAKGGGKAEMIQGSALGTQAEIEEVLNKQL